MPIANCILSPKLAADTNSPASIVQMWSKHSGKDASEMTVSFIRSEQQIGKEYLILSTLLLPTMWSKQAVSTLQLGLASALVEYFAIDNSQVIVMTSLIDSGFVVEGGEELKW